MRLIHLVIQVIGKKFTLLDSDIIAGVNMTHPIRNAYSLGKIKFERYVTERLYSNEKSVFAGIE